MTATIRLASAADAKQIAAIYGPIVEQTAISFETDPPTEAETTQRIESILQTHPWIVCALGDEILGYAYGSSHRSRAAYRWSVETSVYVEERRRGCGIGRALYTSLFSILALQRFYTAYAGITLPNPASIGLHESLGFERIGIYRHVGFKLGTWHDVGWWQSSLQEVSNPSGDPLPLDTVSSAAEFEAALKSGEQLLRL